MKNYLSFFFAFFLILSGFKALANSHENIEKPIISPESGDYWEAQMVNISHKSPEAQIFYTLNGGKPNKNSIRYSGPFKINKASRVNAVAYINQNVSDVTTIDLSIHNWAVAVSEFKLAGETDVKNVKITWEQRKDADYYNVYRNGELIGQTKGDTFDDYGLQVGNTYTYHAEAYKAGVKIATSVSHKATTFTPSDKGVLYDNSRGGNELNRPSGIIVGKVYYSYPIKSITKEIDGKSIKGCAVYEIKSPTGLGDWSKERELAFYPNANFESVNVVYNKKTKKVVIAAHFEDQGGYVAAKLYLAEVKPKGSLKLGFCDKPFGNESRDQSIFIDDDGSAYILSATRMNSDINIYKLNESWTKPDSLINTVFIGMHRETPSIIKKDGEYYFFSSKASGWYPSQSMYASSTNLGGVWTPLKEIGNNSTFATQSTGGGKFGTERETYILWGYHWGAQYNHKDPDGNYARLLPVTFNAGFAAMEYYRYVEYHEKYGMIPVQAGKNLTMGAPVTAIGADNVNVNVSSVTDGADLNSSADFKWGDFPYSLTVDMKKKAQISEINLSTRLVGGSETAYRFTIEASLDGEKYTKLFDGSNNWKVGFLILNIADQTPYRYLRLNVRNVINVQNGNSAPWADGIFELAAFGTPIDEVGKTK